MSNAWSYLADVMDECLILALIVVLWAIYRKEN